MTATVVIPVYGKPDLLVRCLRSLDTPIQGAAEYNICVVDDGSGIDQETIRQKATLSVPLTWVSFDANRGRSAARNEGVRAAQGDVIIFLDSDMEACPGFVRAHIDAHSANSHTACIGHIDWPSGGGFIRYAGTRGVAKLLPGDTPPPWYFVTGNASVMRADLPPGDPFDETLPGWGGEDLDLGLRLRDNGVSFRYLPEAKSYHHFDGTLAQHLKRMERYGSDMVPTLVKRHPEIVNILKLTLLEKPIYRFMINGIFFHIVWFIASLLDFFPLPSITHDYLTFAAYARGYLKGGHV